MGTTTKFSMESADVDQPTVLIISDDTEFSHHITAHWRSEAELPAYIAPTFTLMSSDLCPGLDSEAFDVAIVGGLTSSALPAVIKALESCGKRVLFIRGENQAAPAGNGKSRILTLAQDVEGWLDTVVLIITESFRTSQANTRIKRLEHSNSQMARDAALGRYMLEMRHSLNNALTSVLGNSELLLLEPETLAPLAPVVRSQIDTIRNMSLRMHEILQRFSSLEKELNVAERQAKKDGKDGKTKAQRAGV